MRPWLRILTVTFSNGKNKITFGENYLEDKTDMSISVVGHKYMSSLKDNCTIKINNLNYYQIIRLIDGKYYDVEVKAGYKDLGARTIFKGGVLYISNNLGDKKTSTAIILCASNLVAKFGQKRINLTLNSGVNLYSALKYMCKKSGIVDYTISTQFKKKFLQEVTNYDNKNISTILDNLCENNSSYIVNSDSSVNGSDFWIYDANKSNARTFTLTSKMVQIIGDYPSLNQDGLNFKILPTYNFIPGDVIELDNSIINIYADRADGSNFSKPYFLDELGLYTIYEIEYNLENRGNNFYLDLTCKSRSKISNILGGTND